jgi:hypothetical protein
MTSIDSNQPSDGVRPECALCNAESSVPPCFNGQVPDHQVDDRDSDHLPDFAFKYSKDAIPVWPDKIARFRVGNNEYWLEPAPTRPDMAVELVMDTLTTLQMESSIWLPLLLEDGGPVVYTLRGQHSCILNLSEDSQIEHISVEYVNETMTIHFPPFERWKDVSLAWMIADGCPCGYADCHPAPWRGTPCPFRKW